MVLPDSRLCTPSVDDREDAKATWTSSLSCFTVSASIISLICLTSFTVSAILSCKPRISSRKAAETTAAISTVVAPAPAPAPAPAQAAQAPTPAAAPTSVALPGIMGTYSFERSLERRRLREVCIASFAAMSALTGWCSAQRVACKILLALATLLRAAIVVSLVIRDRLEGAGCLAGDSVGYTEEAAFLCQKRLRSDGFGGEDTTVGDSPPFDSPPFASSLEFMLLRARDSHLRLRELLADLTRTSTSSSSFRPACKHKNRGPIVIQGYDARAPSCGSCTRHGSYVTWQGGQRVS